MFKGTFETGMICGNENIPIIQKFNTNNKICLADNKIQMKTNGMWEIVANINFIATDPRTTAKLYLNGKEIIESNVTISTECGNMYEIFIHDIEKIKHGVDQDEFEYSIRFSTAVDVIGGIIFVGYKC